MGMDWFTRITGFKESTYAATRAQLEVHGCTLRSNANGRSYGIGKFELTSLNELRARVASGTGAQGRPRVQIVTGDVRKMHQAPEYAGALFQVASQFNALETVGPSVTPEDGVTRYEHDHTQGPACAMAAGAATIYRNYFVPGGDQIGQTTHIQLDGLADVGAELSARLGLPVADLWEWRNGYALCTRQGLDLIAELLRDIGPKQADALAGKLRIGIHRDVEVTDAPSLPGPLVNQAFCSALPVAYGSAPQLRWAAFAQMVLDAAYEATMLEAVINARRGASNILLLTRLGGGAFGNASEWIHTAIKRAVKKVGDFDLDVRLVSYGEPSIEVRELVKKLVVSVRTGAGTNARTMVLLREIERRGVPVVNSVRSILIVKDKIATMQHAAASGLLIPETTVLSLRKNAAPSWDDRCRVVKLASGSKGRGVVIAENAIRLRAELDLIRELNPTRPFLVQEWLGDRPGTDVRVFVLGYRAIAAMTRRSNNSDFRASFSQGGDVENLSLTKEIVDISECVCRRLGIEVGGVDLLHKGSDFAIAEVNSSPGFRGLSLATGLDIADRIAAYLQGRVRSPEVIKTSGD